ncbi:hypothetical protein AC481_06130 [miscellaneous Crenarchaeota group archaeon SMTZ-80]|nr:MAG: hypothetical protein AC481_06130 [miscellaneous Crenarchaeota group archaeon SMTZ-80]
MRAARFYQVGKDLKIEKVAVPKVGLDEALVKIKGCGVCHTDIHFIYEGLLKPGKIPQIMGHEPSGEIVELGSHVQDHSVGDKVLIHFYQSCGICHYCRIEKENLCLNLKHFGFNVDGGYSEYAVVGSRHLVKLPEEISYDACILVDSGVTSYHAITKVAKLKPGETSMIMGAGGVGLMLIQIAKLSGAEVFAIDVNEEKLKLAKKVGADKAINSRKKNVFDEVMNFTDKTGVDAVFETVGFENTYEISLNCLSRGGRLVIIGYQPENYLPRIHPIQLIVKEASILTSRAGTHGELKKVVDLLRREKIQLTVTDKFKLEQVNEALSKLRNGEIIGRAIIVP